MQIQDEVEGLHNGREFSQPLSCLYQAMQTRKTFSIHKKCSFFGTLSGPNPGRRARSSFEAVAIFASDWKLKC